MASALERQHNNRAYFERHQKASVAQDDDTYITVLEENQSFGVYRETENEFQDCDDITPLDSRRLLMISTDDGFNIPHLLTERITFERNGVIDFTESLRFQTHCGGNPHDVITINTTQECLDSQCPSCEENFPDPVEPTAPLVDIDIDAALTVNSLSFPCVDVDCEADLLGTQGACCTRRYNCARDDDCQDEPSEVPECRALIRALTINGELGFYVFMTSNGQETFLGQLQVNPPAA